MSKSINQVPKKRARYNKNRIFAFIFVFSICAMLFKGFMQLPQIIDNKRQAQLLTQRIEYEKERQREIDELRAKANTDEYIESVATEKLGLVEKNAKIFVDVSSNEE